MAEHSHNIIMKNSLMDLEYDLTRNFIEYGSPPSLEQLALNKVALSLWQEDATLGSYDNLTQLRTCLEGNISKIIRNLPLIKGCKQDLLRTVQIIGLEIYSFLNYHSKFDLPYDIYTYQYKLMAYIQNICLTSQTTIDKRKTALMIIKNVNLNTLDKYVIACNYCLKDKIPELIEKLPIDFLSYFYNKNVRIYSFVLVFFWTFRVRGEPENFEKFMEEEHNHVYGTENNFAFKGSVYECHEVAVQYIWEKFCDEEIIDIVRLTAYIIDNKWNINIVCYLVSLLNESQQIKLFTKFSHGRQYKMLEGMLQHWRWKDYFIPTVQHMFKLFEEHMDISKVTLLMANIIRGWTLFEDLLGEFLIIFQEKIKKNFVIVCKNLYDAFISIDDLYGLKLLLSFGTNAERHELLLDDFGLRKGVDFISDGDFSLFDTFVDKMINTKEQIKEIKQYFFEKRSIDVCSSLALKDRYDVLEEFLVKFCNAEDIGYTKLNFSTGRNAKVICDVLKIRDEFENILLWKLSAIDKFLNWCSEESKETCASFKSAIFDSENIQFQECRMLFYNEICGVIRFKGMVEHCLKWAFSIEGHLEFHQKFSYTTNLFGLCFLYDLIQKDNNLVFFRLFVQCFFTPNEIVHLKSEFKLKTKQYPIIRRLLYLSQWDIANKFLYWCCSGDQKEIIEFKRNFIHSEGYAQLFYMIENVGYAVEEYIYWFSPSLQRTIFYPKFIDRLACVTNLFGHNLMLDLVLMNDELYLFRKFIKYYFPYQVGVVVREIIHYDDRFPLLSQLLECNEAALSLDLLSWCLSFGDVGKQFEELDFPATLVSILARFR